MGATDYWEAPGSPTEELDIENSTSSATRVFYCDWDDRYDVRAYLLSYNTGKYEYDTILYPIKASIAPFGNRNEAESALNKKSVYEKAAITVNYKPLLGYSSNPLGAGNITGAEFVSQSIDIETQFLSVTSSGIYWNTGLTDAIDEGQAPAKLVIVKNYAITLHRVLTIPDDFDDLIGTVNTDTYNTVKRNGTDTKYAIAVGNLLYKGYSLSRSIGTLGVESCDVTLNFAQLMIDENNAWNNAWNPKTQAWGRLYKSDGAGSYTYASIYPPADWTNLGLPPVEE